VQASSFIRAGSFKSPLGIVAGFLLRSRDTQAKRAKDRGQEIQRLEKIIQQQQRTIEEQAEQLGKKISQIAHLEIEREQLRKQPPMLPDDPPLPHHKFGPKMISLCVNLARRIGLRATPDVLKMFLDWLQVDTKLPDWTAVRTWIQRVGVAAIRRPIEQADDWVLLADHSNQIGTEKVLAILGVRASKMPPPGQALKHDDVRLMMLKPGTSWKREDMTSAYEEVAQRCGGLSGIVVDGAVELREGAEPLQKTHENMVILGDFKHYAANVLKKVVGQDERFTKFSNLLAQTRSKVQQTELAHFTPRSPKPKARFMNLAPMLHWANMVSWHLSHSRSEARDGITALRMNEKLGWLREFRDDIQRWSDCQDVVSKSLTFINEQGLFKGAASQLRNHLRTQQNGDAVTGEARHTDRRKVIARLLNFVRTAESQLKKGQRLPMSTEILESSFGLFKRLERQHSKGGFTSLLAAYGCMMSKSTPASIRRDFADVSVKDTREWISQNLGTTLASKRQSAYRELQNAC
jgi:hypothetical protein